MGEWIPRRVDFEVKNVTLNREESFVLSRIDGTLSVAELADLTGMSPGHMLLILDRLVTEGTVQGYAPRIEEVEPVSSIDIASRPLIPEDEDSTNELYPMTPEEAAQALETAEAIAAAEQPEPEPAAEHHPDSIPPEEEVNHRKLYSTDLVHRSTEERVALAKSAKGDVLLALCYDQEVPVVLALLENTETALQHARLVCFHHRNSVGLDKFLMRADFARDTQVQRKALRNPMLSEPLLKRILSSKRLAEIYKVSLDRDIPDRTRGSARNLLRAKFTTAAPEERFELIWTTEGRVLQALIGCALDSKTTQMICARSVASVMLVNAFCRWPATPPAVLAHLLKQPLVKRQVHLRNMVMQHPNCPSDAKRNR